MKLEDFLDYEKLLDNVVSYLQKPLVSFDQLQGTLEAVGVGLTIVSAALLFAQRKAPTNSLLSLSLMSGGVALTLSALTLSQAQVFQRSDALMFFGYSAFTGGVAALRFNHLKQRELEKKRKEVLKNLDEVEKHQGEIIENYEEYYELRQSILKSRDGSDEGVLLAGEAAAISQERGESSSPVGMKHRFFNEQKAESKKAASLFVDQFNYAGIRSQITKAKNLSELDGFSEILRERRGVLNEKTKTLNGFWDDIHSEQARNAEKQDQEMRVVADRIRALETQLGR